MTPLASTSHARISPAAIRFAWPAIWGFCGASALLGSLYFAYGARLASEPKLPLISFIAPSGGDPKIPGGFDPTHYSAGSIGAWNPLLPAPVEPPPPTPSPTPIPQLSEAIQNWQLESLDEGEAGIRIEGRDERFVMSVDGEPRIVRMESGASIAVKLRGVDLDSATATFTATGQEETKPF